MRERIADLLFTIIIAGCILIGLFWVSSCDLIKKQPEIVKEYVTVTDTLVIDTTVYIPADTIALFLQWAELCDTTIVHDTIYITKNGRKSGIIKRDSTGFQFICREDSLLVVIKNLQQKIKSVQPVNVIQKDNEDWKPLHWILLLFSFALVLLAISRLLSGK